MDERPAWSETVGVKTGTAMLQGELVKGSDMSVSSVLVCLATRLIQTRIK